MTKKTGYPVISLAEWRAQAVALFGEDPRGWKFQCPVCGNIQKPMDFEAAGAEPERAYQECIGRALPVQSAREFASKPGDNGKTQPCDYAAFGLLRLSKAPCVIPEKRRRSGSCVRIRLHRWHG